MQGKHMMPDMPMKGKGMMAERDAGARFDAMMGKLKGKKKGGKGKAKRPLLPMRRKGA